MNFDVVCFGSAMVDAFVQTDTTEEKGHLIIPYGCKQLVEKLYFRMGGGGMNTSGTFSKLGLKTGYIGKIGNDQNGKSVTDILKKGHIEFLGKRVKGKTSGFSVILLSRDHYRSVLAYKGINDSIGEGDVKKFKSKCLYLSSMLGKTFDTQLKLAVKHKKLSTIIAFNPSEYLIKSKPLEKLLKITDILILNKEEAGLLTKKSDKLKGLSDMGPKIVVITNSDKPTFCYNQGRIYSLKPKKIKVVDKTGAGDTFSAGFVAGILKNQPIEKCLELGTKEAQKIIIKEGEGKKLSALK